VREQIGSIADCSLPHNRPHGRRALGKQRLPSAHEAVWHPIVAEERRLLDRTWAPCRGGTPDILASFGCSAAERELRKQVRSIVSLRGRPSCVRRLLCEDRRCA
jgi:hypothetical protein